MSSAFWSLFPSMDNFMGLTLRINDADALPLYIQQ